MSSYTVTIAPDDQAQATATLRVEVTSAGTRILELAVRAGSGDTPDLGQLPALDLNGLVNAVLAATSTGTAAGPDRPRSAEIPPVRAPRRSAARSDKQPRETPAPKKATPRTQAANSSSAPGETAGGSVPAPRRKAAPALTVDTTGTAGTGRTYRRAPEDLPQVLRQSGNAAVVADHYGVPKHTAYGWIRSLRSKTEPASR